MGNEITTPQRHHVTIPITPAEPRFSLAEFPLTETRKPSIAASIPSTVPRDCDPEVDGGDVDVDVAPEFLSKLLILGASGAGKSTLARHMKLLRGNGFEAAERTNFVIVVHAFVLRLFETLVNGAEALGLFPNDATKNEVMAVLLRALHSDLQPRLARQIFTLWQGEALQLAYHQHQHELNIPIAAKHFMDGCERIASKGYVPSDQDILLMDSRSLAITEMTIRLGKAQINVVDVGGRHHSRTEWIQCFHETETVVFVCALDEFDETIASVEGTVLVTRNKLRDALLLFSELVNSRLCALTAKILVLNKKDSFDEKIKAKDLTCAFIDYKGGNDSAKGIEFIKQQFITAIRSESTRASIHISVVSSVNPKHVFEVIDAINGFVQ